MWKQRRLRVTSSVSSSIWSVDSMSACILTRKHELTCCVVGGVCSWQEAISISNIDYHAAKRIIYMLTYFYPERMVCVLC